MLATPLPDTGEVRTRQSFKKAVRVSMNTAGGHTAEAAGEIKAVAIDADVGAEPVEPLTDALTDKRLRMVDVWRRVEVVPRALVATAPEVAVIATDCVGVPVQPAPKLHTHHVYFHTCVSVNVRFSCHIRKDLDICFPE